MLIVTRKPGERIICRDDATGEMIILTFLTQNAGQSIHLKISGAQCSSSIDLPFGEPRELRLPLCLKPITVSYWGQRQFQGRPGSEASIGFAADRSVRIGRAETAMGQEAMA